MRDRHLFVVLGESVLFRLSKKKLNVKPLLFEILLHYIWTSYTFSFRCAVTKAELSLMSNSHFIGLNLSVTAILCNLQLKKKDIVNNQNQQIKYRNIDSLYWLSHTPLNDSTSGQRPQLYNFLYFITRLLNNRTVKLLYKFQANATEQFYFVPWFPRFQIDRRQSVHFWHNSSPTRWIRLQNTKENKWQSVSYNFSRATTPRQSKCVY